MEESLKGEEERYQQSLEKLLSEKESIVFGISDMVRAKCIFGSVGDIIETVRFIKAFAA